MPRLKVCTFVPSIQGAAAAYSGSVMDCRSIGRAIDPAPGASFIPKIHLIKPDCPAPSIALQCGAHHHSFCSIDSAKYPCGYGGNGNFPTTYNYVNREMLRSSNDVAVGMG